VIGSRGLGRVRSALGSVSQEVLHRARVPVVVIPSAAADE
jgi:nucleotide-binding universal stress UspA family protein